jgi:hypothetical protein
MPEERTTQLLVRILTISGQTIDYRYFIPSNDNEAENVVDKAANMITRAMAPKTSALVWFDNPPIVYNPDNILGIRTDLVASEQDKKTIGNMIRKKLGLAL